MKKNENCLFNKKILSIILLCVVMVLGVTGCDKKEQEADKKISEDYDKELVKCLENELGGYLGSETDNLIEIPLGEIKNSRQDKFAYYKGMRANNHSDNKYVIVFPKNGTYDSYVMKDFDKYFYEKFPIYQMSNISSISIYIHTQENNVDFQDITNKCVTRNNTKDGKPIPDETLNKINNTTKMIMKSNQKELGTINDKDKLAEILNAILSSKQYGDTFLCDGNAFEFEMYDSNNQLIDTIYVWNDGKRLIPSSIHSGCSYYSMSNNIDLRKIIEEETDYVFYNILDFRDSDNQKLQYIYQDDKYSYYINANNTNEILIQFMINNKTMTLKYALENKYISAEKVANDYSDILIKQS